MNDVQYDLLVLGTAVLLFGMVWLEYEIYSYRNRKK